MMINILIVDDSTDAEGSVEGCFPEEMFKTYVASGKDHGLAIAERYRLDLIVCNMQSEADGLELVRSLMASELTQCIPIVCIDRQNSAGHRRAVMKLGADDCLTHAEAADFLIEAVESRLDKQKLLREHSMRLCRESLEAVEERPVKNDHIVVNIGRRLYLIKYDDIVCVTAQKEYSKIRTYDGQSIIVRKSLKSWVDLLPAHGFLRIHRASIINIEAIEKIEHLKGRNYVVHLKSLKTPLEFSQRYANVMRRSFPS